MCVLSMLGSMDTTKAVLRIVSGGQTGADRGGLDAALEVGIGIGGWCPKGRLAEDGRIPEKYPLAEMPSMEYLRRTEQNVIDSDATIVLTYGQPESGSGLTVEFAEKHKRLWFHADLDRGDADIIAELSTWISGLPKKNVVLNIAGSRESRSPGIAERVGGIMTAVLREVNNIPEPS